MTKFRCDGGNLGHACCRGLCSPPNKCELPVRGVMGACVRGEGFPENHKAPFIFIHVLNDKVIGARMTFDNYKVLGTDEAQNDLEERLKKR